MLRMRFPRLICAHLLTCMWYLVGRSIEGQSVMISGFGDFEEPRRIQSWTELANATHERGVDSMTQYLHALRWIVNSPSPPVLDEASGVERGLDIMISIFVIAVMGSAVSKISGTLAELRAMNEARDRRRREVRHWDRHLFLRVFPPIFLYARYIPCVY